MPVARFDADLVRAKHVLNSTGLPHLEQAIANAIAEERERCAQVAEHLNGWGKKGCAELAHHIAKIIRNQS